MKWFINGILQGVDHLGMCLWARFVLLCRCSLEIDQVICFKKIFCVYFRRQNFWLKVHLIKFRSSW